MRKEVIRISLSFLKRTGILCPHLYNVITYDSIFNKNHFFLTKNEKRISKLLTRPASLKWSEVESLLCSLGFAIRDAEGSHFILYRPEDPSKFITVSKHGKDTTTIYKIKAKKLYISIFGI